MKKVLLNHSRWLLNKRSHFGTKMMMILFVFVLSNSSSYAQINFTQAECNCLNNQTTPGNGQFDDIVRWSSTAGATWTVVSSTNLYATTSAAPPAAPTVLPVGTSATEIAPGTYEIRVRRIENQVWSMTLTNGTISARVNSIHRCVYPSLVGDFANCVDSRETFRLSLANGMLSNVVWSATPVATATFVGPSTGTNTVQLQFGSAANTGTLSATGLFRPFSGSFNFCNFSVSEPLTVLDEDAAVALACNDLVYLSMNNNCELFVTPDMVLEGMELGEESYDVRLRDIQADTFIPFGTISQKYIGKTLEASVIQECTGNSCWGLVKLEDKSIPELNCISDLTLSCDQLTSPAATGYPLPGTAVVTPLGGNKFLVKNFDFCSDVTLSYSDQVATTSCVGPYSSVITRTWVAEDAQGNQSFCSFNMNILRADLADVVPPANWDDVLGPNPSLDACGNWPKLANGHPDPSYTGRPIGTFCMDATVDYEDQVFPLCASSKTFKIKRRWQIVDHCTDDIIYFNQTIAVMDKVAPVATAPADFTVGTDGLSCGSNILVPKITATSECVGYTYYVSYRPIDSNGVVYGTASTDGVINNGNGTYTLTALPTGTSKFQIIYTLVDDCGNQSVYTTRVTVVDDEQPVPVCDHYTFAGLNASGFGYADINAFDDGSYDNCGISSIEIRRMTATNCDPVNAWGDKIKICCSDIGVPFMVQLKVTDNAGNTNICMVETQVQDNVAPVITNCPANITVDCETDLTSLTAYGTPTYNDNCGATLETARVDNLNDCGAGTITRTFTVTDQKGNKASCSQIITVRDLTPFNANGLAIDWPDDYTIPNGCVNTSTAPASLPLSAQYPTWSASTTCSRIAANYSDIVFQYADGACAKILRKWTVIDWCQFNPFVPSVGRWERTQVIKVMNNVLPNITAGCNASDVVITPNGSTCDALVSISATATDDCTSEANLEWSYSVDVNNNGVVDYTGSTNSFSRTLAYGMHKITWSVTDECGNTKICSNIFNVGDTKKPTPYCLPEIATVIMQTNGQVTIWASDFNHNSSDNCTQKANLRYAFSTNPSNTSKTFSCSDLTTNPTVIDIDMYVFDEAGNSDYCSTTIKLQDNNNVCGLNPVNRVNIAGKITDEKDNTVKDVIVNLTSTDASMDNHVSTIENGLYEFNELLANQSYLVTPKRNTDYNDGITTLDLILIQKHILGTSKLTSPYKLIAADVTNDDKIASTDLVAVRKVILGVVPSFPNVPSWEFVNKNQELSATNPYIYQNNVAMSNLEHDAMNSDFIAIKMGDINNSYTALKSGIETENRNIASISYDITRSSQPNEHLVVFKSDQQMMVNGFQSALSFDASKMEIKKIVPMQLAVTEENFGFTNLADGLMKISYSTESATPVAKGDALFGIVVKVNNANDLHLANDDRQMTSEVYTAEANQSVKTEKLQIVPAIRSTSTPSEPFELFQNAPNPFNETTSISFNLPETSYATVKVFDLEGHLLMTKSSVFEKGFNKVEINTLELEKTGILIYQLDTKTHSASKKMIVIK